MNSVAGYKIEKPIIENFLLTCNAFPKMVSLASHFQSKILFLSVLKHCSALWPETKLMSQLAWCRFLVITGIWAPPIYMLGLADGWIVVLESDFSLHTHSSYSDYKCSLIYFYFTGMTNFVHASIRFGCGLVSKGSVCNGCIALVLNCLNRRWTAPGTRARSLLHNMLYLFSTFAYSFVEFIHVVGCISV